MPWNPKHPPDKLKKRIKKRHPKASAKEIRQFIHVFNSTLKDSGSESKAFSQAWGVLKKNKKLKSSKRNTKKSNILNNLIKLANTLDQNNQGALADKIDEMINKLIY